MTTITNITDTGPAVVAREITDDWWRPLCGKVGFRTRRRLQTLGQEYVYSPSSTVVAEGQRADRFVLIIHGEVEVIVGGEVVATLGEGDYFGEVAMLYTRPRNPDGAPINLRRTATVRTSRATRTREFDRAELMTLLDTVPAVATRISRRAVGRLGALTTMMAEI